MLNFHRVAGTQLVGTEEEAYKYWLRTVRACARAEQAFGPAVVYRFPYSDLIERPEAAMRALLEFLGEPYDARCVGPLQQRINSSNVPEDFVAEDPATDKVIVDQAVTFCAELRRTGQPQRPDPTTAAAMEAEFEQRVQYIAGLDRAYRDCRRSLSKVEQLRR
jgi:hypothetical protein